MIEDVLIALTILCLVVGGITMLGLGLISAVNDAIEKKDR